jgi:hypothetical protein
LASDYASEKVNDEPAIVPPQQDADGSSRFASFALVTVIVGGATLAGMLFTLFWGADRGIEFRDDGLAMLCMANPDMYSQPEAFGYLLRLCPHLVPNDIINVRLLHIISSLAGSSVLAWGFTRWASAQWQVFAADRWSLVATWLASAIGGLMAFAILSPALSYNGLTALFIFSAAGCLFYALSFAGIQNSARAKAALVAGGALVALGFFSKFCAAFLFLALAATMVVVARPRAGIQAACWSAVGIFGGAILFFAIVQPPHMWWHSFSESMRLELSGAHNPGAIFGATGKSAKKHLLEIFVAGAVLAVAYFCAWRGKSSKLGASKSIVIWSTLIATNIGFALFSFMEFGSAHTLLLYVPLLTIAVAGLFFVGQIGIAQLMKDDRIKLLYMVLCLMLLSLVTAVGSNNVLGWEMAIYFAPMVIFYSVAYLVIARYLKSPMFLLTAESALFVTCFAVFFQGYVIDPHGTDSLFDQNETATWPKRIEGLKLSHGDLDFIQKTDRTLRSGGFNDGNRLIALYDLPMLVYAVDAVSAGGAWYYADLRDVPKNEHYMETARHENGPLFLIVYVIKTSPDVQQFLHRHGFDLERDFQQIGTTQREHWGGIGKIYKFLRIPDTH